MAISPHFFSKREAEPTPPRPVSNAMNTRNYPSTAPVANPTVASPAPVEPVAASTQVKETGSKLTVGPNIKLKGVEITDCDTLVVEGMVEATMDSRVIQISEQGAFKGSAEIDIAEIHGHFDGNLTVRQKLIIYATGKVTGKVSYGKLVIEEGGQLSGDIQFGAHQAAHVGSLKTSAITLAG
ncbi:MAG: polymer-forming cytoskeletal protein [Rhodoferax sp.]|uniref:bactofilin family protein n=1 Tax=Rhodoferax sp. TaxID=50421 RepID=UPI0030192532